MRHTVVLGRKYRNTGCMIPKQPFRMTVLRKVIPHDSMYDPKTKPEIPGSVRPTCDQVTLPIYEIKFTPTLESNASPHRVFTPFIAQTGQDWWSVQGFTENQDDITKIYNNTTVGPYSFQVFVSALKWTAAKVKVSGVPAGRRPSSKVNHGVQKRLLMSEIQKAIPAPKRPRISLLAVETVTENQDPMEQVATVTSLGHRQNPGRRIRSACLG
ncbi:hypothetical protein NP233_g11824 [Leucocoprinus birnbaumii]|uniref:Uncharacterized protein n=1 Tax=Leucocoprinus birnbaumii TaxID=56174 RepID=A0AAD5VHD9_9AGAR|nr:hypothetical protein NP233_g11824 [Leucocoprinus birnbaumii]